MIDQRENFVLFIKQIHLTYKTFIPVYSDAPNPFPRQFYSPRKMEGGGIGGILFKKLWTFCGNHDNKLNKF